MAFHHDPFIDLLGLRERAEEDVYFSRQDRERLARLRERRSAVEENRAREAAHMRCPECGEHLRAERRRGVPIEVCPRGHGLWIPPDALETIPEREHDAWFDRYVHMRW